MRDGIDRHSMHRIGTWDHSDRLERIEIEYRNSIATRDVQAPIFRVSVHVVPTSRSAYNRGFEDFVWLVSCRRLGLGKRKMGDEREQTRDESRAIDLFHKTKGAASYWIRRIGALHRPARECATCQNRLKGIVMCAAEGNVLAILGQ